MEDMEDQRNKWQPVVGAAWSLAAVSVVVAIWMVYQHGFGEAPGLDHTNQLVMQTQVNMPVIIGGAFQAVASVLFALLFSMLNSTYQATIEIWWQNHRAMQREK